MCLHARCNQLSVKLFPPVWGKRSALRPTRHAFRGDVQAAGATDTLTSGAGTASGAGCRHPAAPPDGDSSGAGLVSGSGSTSSVVRAICRCASMARSTASRRSSCASPYAAKSPSARASSDAFSAASASARAFVSRCSAVVSCPCPCPGRLAAHRRTQHLGQRVAEVALEGDLGAERGPAPAAATDTRPDWPGRTRARRTGIHPRPARTGGCRVRPLTRLGAAGTTARRLQDWTRTCSAPATGPGSRCCVAVAAPVIARIRAQVRAGSHEGRQRLPSHRGERRGQWNSGVT